MRTRFQAQHLQADGFEMPADLALLALPEHEAELVLVDPFHLRRQQRFAIEARGRGAAARGRKSGRVRARSSVATRTRYSFSISLAFTDQLLGHAPVLREHEQADRIDIQPAGRNQAAQVFTQEARPEWSSRHWFCGVTSTSAGS